MRKKDAYGETNGVGGIERPIRIGVGLVAIMIGLLAGF